jgi:tetratricopeptide (TPR) repeat protein
VPKTIDSNETPTGSSDGSSHRDLSAMIDAGRAFSGNERNCCFLNTRDGGFANLSASSGIDFPDDGRAVAVTDWDQDGDLDLWISNRNAPRLRLMRNDAKTGNHFLALRLAGNGTSTNRDAIGARVEVKLRGGDSKRLVSSLRAGEGFLSQSSKWLHFGLGQDSEINAVTVRWPGGDNEVFSEITADQRYVLTQGSGKAALIPPRDGAINLAPSIPTVATTGGAARIPAVTLLRAPKLNTKRGDGTKTGLGDRNSLLLNLWATWCTPCLSELAQFRDHADKLRAANVDVLALNVDAIGADGASDPAATSPGKVLRDLEFPFPASIATEPLITALQELHNHSVGLNAPLPVPCSFLIDPKGRLSVIYKGSLSIDQLLADVNHSSGTFDERLQRSAQIEGTMIPHSEARRTAKIHQASIHLRYGIAFRKANDLSSAAYHYAAALELDPTSVDGHHTLAQLRSRLGQASEARLHYQAALKLNPDHPLANFEFAALLAGQGDATRAVSLYKSGLKSQPGNHVAANNLAWLLATHPDDKVRNPAEGLRLAQELNSTTGNKVSNILDTLGAAQAANGNFQEAVRTAQRAIILAKAAKQDSLAAGLTTRLNQYKAGKPFVEEPKS